MALPSRFAIPLLLFGGCDGLRVISNGDRGELYASITTPDGSPALAPLPADRPSTLRIHRWEQITDDEGRRSAPAVWFEHGPDVHVVPAAMASVSDLDATDDGRFLDFTVAPLASGTATLEVTSDLFSDHWTLVFE